MLDRVALHNFEGHADLSLDMGKITVLIGPTGSGKSSVLRALALLKCILGGRVPEPPGGAGRAPRQPAGGDAERNSSVKVEGRRAVATCGNGEIDTRFSYRMAFDRFLYPTGADAAVDACCGQQAAGPDAVRLEHSLSHGVGRARVFGAAERGSQPVPARTDGLFTPRIRADLGGGKTAGGV